MLEKVILHETTANAERISASPTIPSKKRIGHLVVLGPRLSIRCADSSPARLAANARRSFNDERTLQVVVIARPRTSDGGWPDADVLTVHHHEGVGLGRVADPERCSRTGPTREARTRPRKRRDSCTPLRPKRRRCHATLVEFPSDETEGVPTRSVMVDPNMSTPHPGPHRRQVPETTVEQLHGAAKRRCGAVASPT